MSRWWRAYDDALHDPKVQRLPPHLFKTWFNLLCIASKHGGRLPPARDLSFLLRRPLDEVRRAVAELVTRRLLDTVGDHVEPHNWATRQYKSDLSTQRVKDYRKRFSNVSETPPRNVSETAPETEADTETDSEQKEGSLRSPARKRATRLERTWMPSSEGVQFAQSHGLSQSDGSLELEKFMNYWTAKSGRDATKVDWDATWRNWVLNAIERKGLSNGRGKQSLGDQARKLAEELRREESARGIGRPPAS